MRVQESAFTHVLTMHAVLARCAAAVYSHPFFPDVHAMVCVLYEDHWESNPDSCSKGKVFPHRIAAAKEALAKAGISCCG
jgi:hypothetical protein